METKSISRKGKTETNVTDLANSFGKLPPQNLEAEEAVLGGILVEKGSLSVVAGILNPNSFYKESNRLIFQAILDLDAQVSSIDILTVTNHLRKQSKLDFVGGPYYLVELTQRVSSAANLEYHARIVSENYIKREIIKVSSELTRDGFDYTTDVFEFLDRAQATLFKLAMENIKKPASTISDILRISIANLEARAKHTTGITGVPCGFTGVDRVTCGWQKSDLIIIAARPGMGKTAMILTAMRNAAVDFKKPVALFSLEMSAVQLSDRLLSAECEIDSDSIKKGRLEHHQWEKLHQNLDKLSSAPIHIDDTPALGIMELRAKARQLKAEFDIQLIIVDYLQLMRGTQAKGSNREQEIGEISRGLKVLAKELDIPVIALSQLSRATETRGGDKRPMLSDLRESGSIEQDADMVIFLYRPEYYGLEVDEDNQPTKGIGEVIIAKHRNGSLDTVKLQFIGQYTKFCDLDAGTSSDNWNSFPETKRKNHWEVEL